jgi:membrane protein implicated in regulation of membrane protease activity
MEFFDNTDSLLHAFWYIALPASFIFLVQTVMTFMGADESDGVDAYFDSDLSGTDAPFQLFSLRNMINFLLGFGWAGVSFYMTISNPAHLILVAVLIGAAFVYFFFLIIKQVQKLAEDNTFKITQTVQKTGTVYLRIPAQKTGSGIVQVSVNGAVHELKAVTDGDEIPSGTMIRVVEILDDHLVLVTKL